jgi:hypothetical protein
LFACCHGCDGAGVLSIKQIMSPLPKISPSPVTVGTGRFSVAVQGVSPQMKVHFVVCGVSWITFFASSFSSLGAMTTWQ